MKLIQEKLDKICVIHDSIECLEIMVDFSKCSEDYINEIYQLAIDYNSENVTKALDMEKLFLEDFDVHSGMEPVI